MHLRTAGRVAPVAAAAFWAFVVVNFNVYQLVGKDAQVQYNFLLRLFHHHVDAAAYQFGFGLVEAPFYALGLGARALGWKTIAGQHPIEPALIALAMGFIILAAGVLLFGVLRDLRLPHPSLALLATAFGTPLFFYVVYYPGKTHAADAALITLSVVLLHRYLRSPRTDLVWPIAMGVVFGFSMTVRYFNGPAAVALVVGLVVLRRHRDAFVTAAAAGVTCGLLFLLPILMHVPIFSQGNDDPNNVLTFQIWNVPKMLFTDHRGMFIWSPVSLLGLLGYVRLFKMRKADRSFLALAGAMGLLIVLSYEFISFWDGGYTFGQRFFTPLAPLIAIGLSGLVGWRPWLTIPATVVAAAWTTFLFFNFVTIGGPLYAHGYTGGGASDLAIRVYTSNTNLGEYAYGIYERSELRSVIPYPFSTH